MRILDAIRRRQAEDAEAQFDPRQMRADVTEAIAQAVAAAYPDVEVSRVIPTLAGPLGGESSRFNVSIDTPVGRRHCIVNVYAAGIYTPEAMAEWGLSDS